ncbi:MAG: DUF167 domain-containing protein [Nitrospirota bacterium]
MPRTKSADGGAILVVRVHPRSHENALVGWSGDTVKVRVTAPPVEGAANTACLSVLSKLLDVPLAHVSLVKGEHSRNKVVRILGLTEDQVQGRLGRPSDR